MIRIPAATLRGHSAALLEALGVPDDQARLVADNLIEADLRGVDSHGVNLLRLYFERIRRGEVQPCTRIRVLRDAGPFVHLDGGLGLGQVAGVDAIDRAVAKAREFGVGVATVRESTHLGALGYYTLRAAERGMIALAFQNGPAFVPPYGGLAGIFSTNPISYAVPAGRAAPVVYDVATTSAAGNKILLARKRGDREIPADWALDADGRPTRDPRRASIQHLQWFGAHKGYGIALLVEVLSGVFADASFGHSHRTESPLRGAERVAKGYLFLALDAGRVVGAEAFRARMDALIDEVHASPPAPGFDRVLVPGELEHERRAERLAAGIPLAPELVAELAELASQLGVAPLGP